LAEDEVLLVKGVRYERESPIDVAPWIQGPGDCRSGRGGVSGQREAGRGRLAASSHASLVVVGLLDLQYRRLLDLQVVRRKRNVRTKRDPERPFVTMMSGLFSCAGTLGTASAIAGPSAKA
jgi:hypothetical protein